MTGTVQQSPSPQAEVGGLAARLKAIWGVPFRAPPVSQKAMRMPAGVQACSWPPLWRSGPAASPAAPAFRQRSLDTAPEPTALHACQNAPQAAMRVQRAAARLGRTLASADAPALLSPLDEELGQLLESIIGADPTTLAAIEQPMLARHAAAAAARRTQQPAAQPLLPPRRIPPSCAAAFPQPPECAFLRPGQRFEGRQRVAAHHLGPAKQVRPAQERSRQRACTLA